MNTRALKIVRRLALADTRALLAEGGDARIALESGRNEYGCRPYPDPDLAALGSSTASTISESGYAAAEALREKILANPDEAGGEFDRIRDELSRLCGISDLEGLEIVFAASGTDAHLIASQIVKPACAVMVDGTETGRGVPSALSGRHFSTRIAFCGKVMLGMPLSEAMAVMNVRIRAPDGMPRDCGEIDMDVVACVESVVEKGGKVLLVLADVTKTGMIAPSLSCAIELRKKFPASVEVLVDACQFRMSPSTLRAYLEQGFMVALTGSKFLTGPTFSGALLMPQAPRREIPKTLKSYSSRYEWPEGMRSDLLGDDINFGLLLRWEAALAELRAFCNVPEEKAGKFLLEFAQEIGQRLEEDARFESLPVPPLDRRVLVPAPGWDSIQTIFPFMLKRGGLLLGLEETKEIHAQLQEGRSGIDAIAGLRYSLGQPVSCAGKGALRLCASARLVVEGALNGDAVINRALAALDRVAMLLD